MPPWAFFHHMAIDHAFCRGRPKGGQIRPTEKIARPHGYARSEPVPRISGVAAGIKPRPFGFLSARHMGDFSLDNGVIAAVS